MTAEPGPPRRRARHRRALVVAAPLACAGLAAAIVLGGPALRDERPAAAGAVTVSTAPVVRTDLANTTQVPGSLGYQGSYSIVNQTPGTAFTELPGPGATVRRGQRVYEVDGTPVILFYGSRPAWRTLAPWVLGGPDIAQLDANLIALGYGAGLTVSDYFTYATSYAVELWQQAHGLPVTGTVPLGQIVFTPGPLRISSANVSLGMTPQPGGQVLTATSPVPVVQTALPVGQEYLVKAGQSVSVTLPDGVTTTPGTVASVSQVATAAAGSGSGGASGGGSGGGSGGASPGPASSSQATVAMIVRLTHPAATGNLDQAPVTVNIVTARAQAVLAVPVSALVALAGGGYAVQVVDGAARRLVAVQPGLFAGTLVQVSGPGLSAGLRVEVPSS